MKQYFNIILILIFFIFEPENSASCGPDRLELILKANGFIYAGAIKAIFWIITSISAGLGIARL